MKSDNIAQLLMLFIIILIPAASRGEKSAATVNGDSVICGEGYILDGGRIYRVESGLKEISVEGNILGINHDNDAVYYIRETEKGWSAGSFKKQGGDVSEYALGPGFRGLSRFLCHESVFYFLADYADEGNLLGNDEKPRGAGRFLVRFNPDTGERKFIDGVEDFSVAENRIVILTPSGLDCNGFIIPLSLTGSRYIDRILDGRFVFISNGSEVEIIDTLSERNIYIYREGKAFPYSSEYNVILEFSDSVSHGNPAADNENMIYYQVNLNGIEAGRTETSASIATKSSMIKTEPGRYCVIKTERWELDKTKGRYVRANNIYQPGEIKLFVPENRIIKIRFDFNGEKYRVNQSVYEN